MTRWLVFAAMAWALVAVPAMASGGAPTDEIRALYDRFLAAQNARDLEGVRAVLWTSPNFQWVSDGKSFWGPDALVERMAGFQKAEVWKVIPDRSRAKVVDIAAGAAYLFQPLVLRIGSAENPGEIPFLVNVLAVETAEGWRIAALFTTTEKRQSN
jgi:uncharacterized protein (TIGR02246 family)